MKAIKIDVSNIREKGVIADIGDNLKLDLIYNNYDEYIYVSVLDDYENRITGYNRLVQSINLLQFSNNKENRQLRCIKVNEFAEERDKITPENLNQDYIFFLIMEEQHEIMEAS